MPKSVVIPLKEIISMSVMTDLYERSIQPVSVMYIPATWTQLGSQK